MQIQPDTDAVVLLGQVVVVVGVAEVEAGEGAGDPSEVLDAPVRRGVQGAAAATQGGTQFVHIDWFWCCLIWSTLICQVRCTPAPVRVNCMLGGVSVNSPAASM